MIASLNHSGSMALASFFTLQFPTQVGCGLSFFVFAIGGASITFGLPLTIRPPVAIDNGFSGLPHRLSHLRSRGVPCVPRFRGSTRNPFPLSICGESSEYAQISARD